MCFRIVVPELRTAFAWAAVSFRLNNLIYFYYFAFANRWLVYCNVNPPPAEVGNPLTGGGRKIIRRYMAAWWVVFRATTRGKSSQMGHYFVCKLVEDRSLPKLICGWCGRLLQNCRYLRFQCLFAFLRWISQSTRKASKHKTEIIPSLTPRR